MGVSALEHGDTAVRFSWNEVTGAIGDSVTVLPIVVGVSALSDLSLSWMLLWFGVFQIVWGLYYGVPISVEPMKALGGLVIAGALTVDELLLAGLILGVVLLAIGTTGWLAHVERYVPGSVVRGIQFGVALLLFETGFRLGIGDPFLGLLATGFALALVASGRWNVTALAILAVGGLIAGMHSGVPEPTLPPTASLFDLTSLDLTISTVEAAAAQFAMTVGNAALAASILLKDYFDRDVSADQLSQSMGVMNLIALPFGAFPMCHGSGGIAGKYAFGARTAGANVVLGMFYVGAAVFAVGLVTAYPTAVLGVVLALVALQLGRTSLEKAGTAPLVVGIGVLGVLVNLGAAFVVGIFAANLLERYDPGILR
ncbi:MAG: putative sulfate/molybdate transporter [archaeon]